MSPLNSLKSLWPVGLALAVAIGAAVGAHSWSRAVRLSNLATGISGFSETYLMRSKDQADRGFVVDRRDSTIRRSDTKQPGDKWRIYRIPGRGVGDTWLTQSKRKGKGSVFYVPVEAVADWSFPFVYDWVQKNEEAADLPKVRWTKLYVDRVFQGLYLRAALPFDKRKKDGGSGVLRELLAVRGDHLFVINSRFADDRGVYVDAISEGHFPALVPPSPAVAWLARFAPVDGLTLVLHNKAPFDVRSVPLPVDLPGLFEARYGRRPARFEDGRYARWIERAIGPATPPFTPAEHAALDDAFSEYARDFQAALRAHGALHQTTDALAAMADQRQAAARALGLDMGLH